MADGGSKETAQAARTKAKLITLAIEIMEEQGIEALKIRELARRSSLSVSVVNHHFGSKQGLLDACKKDYYKGLAEVAMAAIGETAGQPIEALVDLAIRDTFSYSRVRRAVLQMLTRDVFIQGGLIESHQKPPERPHFNPMLTALAPRLGLDVATARVRLQAVSVVLSRFATAGDAELEALFGASGNDALAAAEDHLVDIAKLLLIAKRDEPEV